MATKQFAELLSKNEGSQNFAPQGQEKIESGQGKKKKQVGG